jgi:hypothetical protein
VVRQDQPIGKDLLCRQTAVPFGRSCERSAQGRQAPPEPLLLRIATGTWSRFQQGRQDIGLWMGEIRAIDGRYTVTLG